MSNTESMDDDPYEKEIYVKVKCVKCNKELERKQRVNCFSGPLDPNYVCFNCNSEYENFTIVNCCKCDGELEIRDPAYENLDLICSKCQAKRIKKYEVTVQ